MLIAWYFGGFVFISLHQTLWELPLNYSSVFHLIPRQGFIRPYVVKKNMWQFCVPVVPLFTTIGANQERRNELFISKCLVSRGQRKWEKQWSIGLLCLLLDDYQGRSLKGWAVTSRCFVFPHRKLFSRFCRFAEFLLFLESIGYMSETFPPT
jgi:hypothetical protein